MVSIISWEPYGLIGVTRGFRGCSSIIISFGCLTDNTKSITLLGSGLSDKLNLCMHQN